MKKYSFLAILVAITMIITGCTSAAGLKMKEAFNNQLELESFEAKSTVSVSIDTALMKNDFAFDLYTRQQDMFHSLVELYFDEALFQLLGINVPADENGKVTVSFISDELESYIATPADDIGIQLSNYGSMLTDEFGENKDEEFKHLVESMQEVFVKVMREYVKDYGYSMEQIKNLGEAQVVLPNGEKVTTEHIEIQLSVPEMFNMLQYSLQYLLESEELQDLLYEEIASFPALVTDFANVDLEEVEDIDEEAMKNGLKELLELAITELESFEAQYLDVHKDILKDTVQLTLDTYIGKKDKQIYQSELEFKVIYTESAAQLELEGMDELPLVPGDSITIAVKDQYWNHNKEVEPIKLPSKIISIEEIMEAESAEQLKERIGNDTVLGQFSELIYSFVEMTNFEFGFAEIRVNENQIETVDEVIDSHLYIKNGQLMAPLKIISESLGAEVLWDGAAKQIVVIGNGHIVEVNALNNEVKIDGVARADILIEVVNGESYVNIRTFADAMDWTLIWDDERKSAIILQ